MFTKHYLLILFLSINTIYCNNVDDLFRDAAIDCETVRAGKLKVQRAPIGRGTTKEVFLGRLVDDDDTNQHNGTLVVVKMPLYNRVTRNERWLQDRAQWYAQRFGDGVRREADVMRRVLHVNPTEESDHFAHYLGACLGTTIGDAQIAVQSGPYLELEYIEHHTWEWAPWSYLHRMAVSTFELAAFFQRNDLVHCDWNRHAIGYDRELRAVFFDIEGIQRYDLDADDVQEYACETDFDCEQIVCLNFTQAQRNMRREIERHACERHRATRCYDEERHFLVRQLCEDVLSKTIVQKLRAAAIWSRAPLALVWELESVVKRCTTVSADAPAWHVEQILDELAAIGARFNVSARLISDRQRMHEAFDEQVRRWALRKRDMCAEHRLCTIEQDEAT